jgi:hypothetical protein
MQRAFKFYRFNYNPKNRDFSDTMSFAISRNKIIKSFVTFHTRLHSININVYRSKFHAYRVYN